MKFAGDLKHFADYLMITYVELTLDYDLEKGMVTTLKIFANECIYDYKFIINSEYYAITFGYVKAKEKGQCHILK